MGRVKKEVSHPVKLKFKAFDKISKKLDFSIWQVSAEIGFLFVVFVHIYIFLQTLCD